MILVSTIHQSKGREYDNVFVILEQAPISEEDNRCIYVAMTRAKSNLFVGYNGGYFEPIARGMVKYVMDPRSFSDPTKISITLGLKHVILGRFVNSQENIKDMIPGQELWFKNSALLNKPGNPIVYFSAKFRDRMDKYLSRGFVLESARVNQVVYWWDDGVRKEVMTVLPELVLRKEKD